MVASRKSKKEVRGLQYGYTLIDGVARNKAYPRTFEIPGEKERTSLTAGMFAKCGFESAAGGGERMWVIVKRRVGKGANLHYKGVLDNDPIVLTHIKLKDRVTFWPEHILSILEAV